MTQFSTTVWPISLSSKISLTVGDGQVNASIFAEPVVVHDTVNSNGLGTQSQVLKLDLADSNLVIKQHIIVHYLAGQDKIVDTFGIRDLPGERLVVIRANIIRLLGGTLVAVVLVKDHILIRDDDV